VHYGGPVLRAVAVVTGVGAACLLTGIVGSVLDPRSVASGGSAVANALVLVRQLAHARARTTSAPRMGPESSRFNLPRRLRDRAVRHSPAGTPVAMD
jgi:hypothetical protein